MKPKVTLLIDSLGSGGAQQQLALVAGQLVQRGVVVQVVWYTQGKAFVALPDGVVARQMQRHHPRNPAWLLALRRELADSDLVHAWMESPSAYAAVALAGLRKRPALVSGIRCSLPTLLARKPFAAMQLAAAWASDAVVSNSADVLPWLRSRGVAADRLYHTPNSLAPKWQHLQASTPAEQALVLTQVGCDPAQPPILLVGRFDRWKNQDGLVRALAIVQRRGQVAVPPVLLLGALEDPARVAHVRLLASQHGLSLVIGQPVPNVSVYMQAARLLVLCSHAEGSPNVVLEGLAAGANVVATAVGEVPNLIRAGQTGLTCQPNSDDALADMLEKALLLSQSDWDAMRLAGQQDVRVRFAADRQMADLLAIYQTAVGRAGRQWPGS
jgi:glycosyltransferase involved in cell wall biosynthesis